MCVLSFSQAGNTNNFDTHLFPGQCREVLPGALRTIQKRAKNAEKGEKGGSLFASLLLTAVSAYGQIVLVSFTKGSPVWKSDLVFFFQFPRRK